MKRNKASYVGGAAALLVSSVTVKILGALFKIPLTNLIGDSGMGLFAFAMQFFSLLFVVSAAGIPAAEAHLVSEALAFGRRQQAKAIAVRAGNAQGIFIPLHYGAPSLRALEHGDAHLMRSYDLGVIFMGGGSSDDKLRIGGDVRCIVADEDLNTLAAEI